MKMKRILTLILVIAVAFTMAGCSSSSSTPSSSTPSSAPSSGAEDLETALANMEPMELNMPINLPGNHILTQAFETWADSINEVTKGKITVTIHRGGTLLKSGSIYQGVRDGVAEIGEEDLAYNPSEFPLFGAFFMGGIKFPDTITASKAVNDWVHADFEEYKDVKMLWAYSMPPSVLMGNKKIEKLEDLQGTQVRVTGFCQDTIKRLGGTPVGITMSETYDALLKGTVDLNMANPGVMGAPLNLGEVSKYMTITPGISNIPHVIFMNLDAWNSIPPAVQAEIEKINLEAVVNTAELGEKYYNDGLQISRDKNIEIIELSDTELQRWYDVLKSQHDDWIKEKNAAGLDGQGAYDYLIDLVNKYSS
ncbi:MAG: hypothetical protein APF84_17410 [Gracilibacter sp. BRH_c7a]|nr:MAG: hypothetical protein APF84_17410 [Gracilibacter sp. BRH_c7a]